MNYKKIKCVVLDFDNTLYSYGNWEDEHVLYAKFLEQENILPEIKDGEEKLKYMRTFYPNFHLIQTMYAYLHDNNIDDKAFRDFNEENIADILTDEIVFINPKVIEKLAQNYKVYIISDSQMSYLNYYLKYAGVDLSNFSGILSNGYDDEDYTKIPMMKKVLKETGLKPEEVVMVGDNPKTDIAPAKLVGFQTHLVEYVSDTEKFLNKLINLKSSKSN